MIRLFQWIVLGQAFLAAAVALAQETGDASTLSTVFVKGWRLCDASGQNAACMSRESLQHVKVFENNGRGKGEMDLSALQPSGRHVRNGDYDHIDIKLPSGATVWVPTRYFLVQYCDGQAAHPEQLSSTTGRRPTAQAIGMGSGNGCPQ